MFKKLFNLIMKIAIVSFIILFILAVARPLYLDYQANKKEIVVDKSGELAMPKIRAEKESAKKAVEEEKEANSTKNNSDSSDEEAWRLERKEEYDPFNFDDRILLYEGNINSDSMKKLMDILIEDVDSQTFSKVDISLNGSVITYNDKDSYVSSLLNFKNEISNDVKYNVSFEYNTIRTVVNKVIITNN